MRRWIHKLSNIDATSQTATCANCGPVRLRKKQDGWRCGVAEQKWDHTPASRLRSRFKQYGLTEDEFYRMARSQNGLCAICKRRDELVIDHDHKTERVRALLCKVCNAGLGMFQDNPALLIAAADYLKRKAETPLEVSAR